MQLELYWNDTLTITGAFVFAQVSETTGWS